MTFYTSRGNKSHLSLRAVSWYMCMCLHVADGIVTVAAGSGTGSGQLGQEVQTVGLFCPVRHEEKFPKIFSF